MRVLLVVHGFPPAASGGTEIYTQQLAEALNELPGLDVCVLTRECDWNRPEYSIRHDVTASGVTVFRINNTFQACTSFEESYTNPDLAAVAARIIDEQIDPDVIHLQHLTCLSTGIVTHASVTGRPVAMTLNDCWILCHRGQLLRPDGTRCDGPFDGGCASCIPADALASPTVYRAGRLTRALPLPGAAALVRVASQVQARCTSPRRLREASEARLDHLRHITSSISLFLAPSATVEAWSSRLPIECWRLFRCEQGIDLRPFANLVRRPSDTLRLAFAGSLIPSKAPHVLLEAAAALPLGRVTVDLLGALTPYHGDRTYSERLAPLLGQSFVRKLGPIPHERMADALSDVDALVVPSVWIENAPFVIREAFAAGLPVLASNLGGMAEMVRHEENGLLFAPGSSTALASQIRRLLDEPDLMAHLRQHVRPPISIQQEALKLRQRYEDLLWTPDGRSRMRTAGRSASRAPRTANRDTIASIVLNYRTPDQTWLAVRSLQTSTVETRVWVVDNGSSDHSFERLTAMPDVTVLDAGRNLGFAGGCNLGIRAALEAGASFVLLVNSDAVLAPDSLATLLAIAAARPQAGILAPIILSREEPDRVASAGIRFSVTSGRMRHIAAGQRLSGLPAVEAQAVDAVSGCVMLIRRQALERVGGFDEAFFFSFEDIELCLRVRKAGFEVLSVPAALAYHEGGTSIGRTSPQRVYFAARNHLRLARMAGAGPAASWLRSGLIVGLNAGYVLLSGETPRVRGFAALARGVWHHLGERYGPA
jgi:GT2 family glycosyltransferase/glycosyltransferase involved in cell wall biosynthesis